MQAHEGLLTSSSLDPSIPDTAEQGLGPALHFKSNSYTFPSSFDLLCNCVVNRIHPIFFFLFFQYLPIFTLGWPKATAAGHFLLLPLLQAVHSVLEFFHHREKGLPHIKVRTIS